jgi:very-short-patch-repair endonuclease
LWRLLRTVRTSHGLHFRRQVPIGPYIADFACHSLRLIVEADGRAHDEVKDARRDAWFKTAGYRTLRFSNWQIMEDWSGVVGTLEVELGLRDACGS